jgi:hypothetical protein
MREYQKIKWRVGQRIKGDVVLGKPRGMEEYSIVMLSETNPDYVSIAGVDVGGIIRTWFCRHVPRTKGAEHLSLLDMVYPVGIEV